MFRYGVIVIGYKNVDAIQRLLSALNRAEYGQDDVTLVIGIDYSEESEVKRTAEEFEWKYGKKIIRFQSSHLGLKRHILTCGNYINEYGLDAVAVFEDDTMPSCDFYQYMKAATEKYYYENDIAGISLYLSNHNFNADQPFCAIINDQDAFFLQYPQSWGQIWMKNQWNDFYAWYKRNEKWEDNGANCHGELPQNIMSWKESWLKYHVKYCIAENKYFVYPYVSHATCFAEKGVHTSESSNRLQVPIPVGLMPKYDLPDWCERNVCYDAFYENVNLYQYIDVPEAELTVDLYGMHTYTARRYLLTCRELPYKCIRTWGNRLTPHDMNIICDIPGKDIFLYDLEIQKKGSVELPVYKKRNKAVINCMILDKLLTCKEQGIRFDGRLALQGIESVAIYGCGVVGRHFAEELKGTAIKIKCFIDQYTSKNEIAKIRVLRWEDDIPQVDAIIVTPVYDYEKIYHMLKQTYGKKIISIWDLII